MVGKRWLALALLALLAAGCTRDPAAPLEPQEVTGRWTAHVDGRVFAALVFDTTAHRLEVGFGFADRFFLDLLLVEEEDGRVTGAGFLHLGLSPAAARSIGFRVEGVALFPRISIILRSAGFRDVNISGTWFGSETIRARVHGAGFEAAPIRLRRRPLEIFDTTGLAPGDAPG